MGFTTPNTITVTFDANRKPDIVNPGGEFTGSNLAKEIWFSFGDEDLSTGYTVVVNAKRPDKALAYGICEKTTVNGETFFVLKLNTWYTELVGTVTLSVKVYESSDIVVDPETGEITLSNTNPFISVSDVLSLKVNYAPNADGVVTAFDPTDVQIFLSALGNRPTFEDTVYVVSALPTLTGGDYDGWTFLIKNNDNTYTVYKVVNETATAINEKYFRSLMFDTANAVPSASLEVGGMTWASNNKGLLIRYSSSFTAYNTDRIKYVKSSEILAKGDVVQFVSATGGFVSVKKAVPSEINAVPHLILGFAGQAFTANGFGFILTDGVIEGISTSAGLDGDRIYFDSSNGTSGLWTATRPTPPKATVVLGTIGNSHGTLGSIDIRISFLPMSDQVNHDETPTNYTATTKTVKDNLNGIDTALGARVLSSSKGQANGVAPLESDSKISSTYLPSYVDDILEYDNLAGFPVTGETGKIYVAKDTNLTYRWSGSAYTEISQSLALGETSSSAYRGDRGKIAYDHSQLATGTNPHATTFANIASKPTTMGGYGITDGVRVLTDLSTPLNTAYTTIGRQIAVNGANDSYVLVLFPDVAAPSTYNGRFYCGSSRIGVRAFRQLSSSATIQQAFDASVASAKQDCYELITGSDFALLIGVTSLYNQGLYEIKDSSSATYRYGSRYSLSYYGVATLLALPDAIVSGLADKADKLYATNLVTNGNFVNTDNWYAYGSATFSVANNELTGLAPSENHGVQNLVTLIDGHIYYFYAQVKATTPLVQLRLRYSWDLPLLAVSHSGSGNYELLSAVCIASAITNGNIAITDQRTSGFDNFYVKYVGVIDLTATFGAGKEPTVEEMDALLASKFTNSYFDGTAELQSIKDIHLNKADKLYATNLVTNGNFVNTDNWYAYGSATFSVANNELTGLAPSENHGVQNLVTLIDGHIYYFYAQVKATTPLVQLRLRYSWDLPLLAVSHSGSGNYELLSAVCIASAITNGNIAITDQRTSGFDNFYVKYVGVIDLTATSGAGNEPTVEQMDAIMALFPNSYFNGTAEIMPLASLPTLFVSKAQEDWYKNSLTIYAGGNLTDVSGPPCFVWFRKDAFGVVTLIVKISKTATSGWACFTMPSGYRPLTETMFSIGNYTSNTIGAGYLATTGVMNILDSTAAIYEFIIQYPTI